MMRARYQQLALLAAALVVGPTAMPAQPLVAGAGAPASPSAKGVPVPFAVGERLDYQVKFGSLKVGNGSMEVKEITEVRGRPVWHTTFTIKGGIPLYRVNDVYESWFDVQTLNTLRYHQDVDEGSYERKRRYEIYPERGMMREGDREEEPTVANPLDEGSFLYFVRTLPLEVGKSYEFQRYFKAQGNPVRIRVLRAETVTVPAGTFKTVVLQPTFQTKGIFSQNGRAEVWITDDDRRLMVQMKSKLSFGSLNLYLEQVRGAK
ncbi:DUF3108 domain-containing protein [Gemmatimonas sp.]|jgi:hypothetical protein|uniref:DUF3108 domain-containing protein n=1 Tax=Gemmatimonas sp. TaxID=1962908 RepID=UPI0022BFBC84|nr:DUF3108 domain-containing protein [Gemmatimonas sp.]MCZ8204776.1 DUF3108 domain-containing protein [Gemmatimonas sp.]